MSAQKTLLNFFQKQPGTKRMLECTTNIVASSSEAAEEKEAQILYICQELNYMRSILDGIHMACSKMQLNE